VTRPSIYTRTRVREQTPSGGMLPSIRTAYTLAQREALNALAESRPTLERYLQERQRILAPSWTSTTR
jgi:hypothetical protein